MDLGWSQWNRFVNTLIVYRLIRFKYSLLRSSTSDGHCIPGQILFRGRIGGGGGMMGGGAGAPQVPWTPWGILSLFTREFTRPEAVT